jgi:hypothetical protein
MTKIHSYSEWDGKVAGELVQLSRQIRRKTEVRPRVDSPSRQGEEPRRCRPSPARRLRETSPAPPRRSDSDDPRSRVPQASALQERRRWDVALPQGRNREPSREPRHGWEDRRGTFLPRLRCPRESVAGSIRRLAGKSKPTAPLSAISIRSRVSNQLGTGFSVALTVQS